MNIEPYCMLDIDIIETYVKCLNSPLVTRSIKISFMALDKFLNSLVVKEIKSEDGVQKLMEATGIESVGKVTLLFNKVLNGKEVSASILGNATIEEVKQIVSSNCRQSLTTSDGTALTDFQTKLVTHLKKKLSGLSRGNKKGIDFIIDLIDRSEVQSTSSPYVLGRSLEKIVDYTKPYVMIKALDIVDKRDVANSYANIENFESNFLKYNKSNESGRLKALIAKEDSLKYLLSTRMYETDDLNGLAREYLLHKLQDINYEHFNKILNTSLTERQMHREFMDLTKRGLVGFNLCTDLLTDEVKSHGARYQTLSVNSEDLQANANIQFIVNNIKPLLNYELDYRR